MNIGVVIIGRNEGERLCRCIDSICSLADVTVYVDSDSTDNSIDIVKAMGIDIVELDASMPFSAARARNEGFAYLLKQNPKIQFVQFIDGDCQLTANWLEKGSAALNSHADYAAVVGHLHELNPDASIYNRLCALEWRLFPVGDLTENAGLGGISMMRTTVFKKLGGFNPNIIAGEEPELAVRIAQANYKVIKLDHAMAVHDADMHRFSQWWKRAIRSGHAIGQRAFLNEKSVHRQGSARERNSIWFWGGGLPLFVLLTAVLTSGWSFILLIGYFVLGARVYRYSRKRGNSQDESLLYVCFILIGKFAEAIGMLKFFQNRRNERYEIIEYK